MAFTDMESSLSTVVIERLGETNEVMPSVIAEIDKLVLEGVDVAITHTPDACELTPERQTFINAAISELESSKNGAEAARAYLGIAAWSPLTKRAIALHPIYNPNAKTMGEGINPAIYDTPLFNGRSANEILRSDPKMSGERAERWIKAYQDFLPSIIDDGGLNEVGSRDFFKGTSDARAVRTRATTAMEMAAKHVSESPVLNDRQDLVSASLACGAAVPVYNLVKELDGRGHGFSEVVLIDQDPMALATAASLAEEAGLGDKTRIEMRDLLKDKIIDYIAPQSVDVVDLLGLFEYIPNDEKWGKWATFLLANVKTIVKPGGIVIFGNMLYERPQQEFFNKVIKWHKLQQRTISEVLAITSEAGFDDTDVSIRIPQEGVYAVYAIKIPELVSISESHKSVADEIGRTALESY